MAKLIHNEMKNSDWFVVIGPIFTIWDHQDGLLMSNLDKLVMSSGTK